VSDRFEEEAEALIQRERKRAGLWPLRGTERVIPGATEIASALRECDRRAREEERAGRPCEHPWHRLKPTGTGQWCEVCGAQFLWNQGDPGSEAKHG
jgi:hypothetical protein